MTTLIFMCMKLKKHASDENTSPTVEAEATTVNSVSTADTATNDSASANTGSNSTGSTSATSTSGNVQTGGNVHVEAILLLTFSVSSLAVLWFKRRLFF